jgi:hypothetical protein
MTDVITIADKLACAKRELGYRKRVYQRLVDANKMSVGKMAHEIACMQEIVADYELADAKERLL